MEKSINQLEKNMSASFGYVKKDMLMLNDAFSDIHEKMQHLSLNHATLLAELGRLRKEVRDLSGKKPTAKPKAKLVKKSSSNKNNLTLVDGIGPAIEKLLHKNSIKTFKELSKTTVNTLQGILDSQGTKFQVHDPKTWPKKASLLDKAKK